MRLETAREKQLSIDFGFWGLVLAVLVVIGGASYYAKRLTDRAAGRDVQALLAVVNLDRRERFMPMAKSYMTNVMRGRTLKPDVKEKATNLLCDAFYERNQTWVKGMMDGVSPAEIKRLQAERYQAKMDEFTRLVNAAPVQGAPSYFQMNPVQPAK